MIIERIKRFFEFQRRSVHGPVPLWGVLNGIFILYPIAFFMFMAVGLEILKNEDLYQGLLIAGIAVASATATFVGLFAAATAPAWLPGALAIGASAAAVAGLNWFDKKFNITDNLKKGANSLIKGMRGWFK